MRAEHSYSCGHPFPIAFELKREGMVRCFNSNPESPIVAIIQWITDGQLILFFIQHSFNTFNLV